MDEARVAQIFATERWPATEAVREVVADEAAARTAPARDSRWRRTRRAAEGRYLEAIDWLTSAESQLQEALVDEALQRLRITHRPDRPWQRIDAQDVIDEVTRATGHPRAALLDHEQVARTIYGDAQPHSDPRDLDLVSAHSAALPDHAQQVLALRSTATRPNSYGAWGDPHHNDLLALLNDPAARLPRPITVWRGEHPSSAGSTSFATTTRTAMPGDVLQRAAAISASMNPAVAGQIDFCGVPLLRAPRRHDDGWVLQLRTRRALYLGAHARGLAYEQEVVVHAPQLRVEAVTEALLETRMGPKRVHLITCVDDDL